MSTGFRLRVTRVRRFRLCLFRRVEPPVKDAFNRLIWVPREEREMFFFLRAPFLVRRLFRTFEILTNRPLAFLLVDRFRLYLRLPLGLDTRVTFLITAMLLLSVLWDNYQGIGTG